MIALRYAARELRAGVRGLRIVLACLALGVGALPAGGGRGGGVGGGGGGGGSVCAAPSPCPRRHGARAPSLSHWEREGAARVP